MTLLVLGISHRSAPVRVLDQLALTVDQADQLAADLTAEDCVAEAVVLSTCNRVEVYADVTRFHPAVTAMTELLAKAAGADQADLGEHSYVHFDSAAAAHLFSVTSGLDSMVVGEGQILGQVRASLVRGQEAGTAGRALNEVVQHALRVGKRVHTETAIDRSGVSIVSVALDAAADIVGDLTQRSVLIVGAGSMGALAASALQARGARGVVVANRTAAAAERVAAVVPGGRGVGLAALEQEVAAADIALFCTGALDVVLERGALGAALTASDRDLAQRPLVVLDLALPHDTAPDLADLPGVVRIDLEAVAQMPAAAASESDVERSRKVVSEEVLAYGAAVAAHQVEPLLVSVRAQAGSVLDAEMSRLRMRLAGLDDASFAEVERAMRRAMAALLHTPTVRMKQLAAQPGGDRYAQALSTLFGLDPKLPASVADPSGETGQRGERP